MVDVGHLFFLYKNMQVDVTQNGTFSLSKLVDICRTVVLVVLCQIMYNVNNNYNTNAKIQKKL